MKPQYKFRVESQYEGYSLQDFVRHNLPQYSQHTVRRMGYDGAFSVNGEKANLKHRLTPGDKVAVAFCSDKEESYHSTLLDLDVLYEDDGVLIVNKPPGIPVVKERWTPANLFKDSVHSYLADRGIEEPPGTIHRIDKEASGVVIFGKTKDMERYLSMLFETRKIEKKYFALVAGVPPEDGTVDLPISPLSSHNSRMIIDMAGKPAVTHYHVVEAFRDFALLEVVIETGRTHQIRVHLSAEGYPLAVDSLYGYRSCLKVSDIKSGYRRKGKTEKPFISRITLHARQVSFELPDHSKTVVAEAPLPEDFQIALKMMRKYRKS